MITILLFPERHFSVNEHQKISQWVRFESKNKNLSRTLQFFKRKHVLWSTVASAAELLRPQPKFRFERVFIYFGVHFNPTLLTNVQKESTKEPAKSLHLRWWLSA